MTFFSVASALACQCPPSSLSIEECDKYEIIFKGRILSVAPCGDKFGEAIFEIDELYKGNSAKKFTVLFECNTECYQQFMAGEEWIIYSRYKQVNNAKMDWCSRSRKFFNNLGEDFYAVNYGNDYDDEVKFLRDHLGRHRFMPDSAKDAGDRNTLPDTNQTILLFVCSLLAIILFYWLFNKYFKF
ncbi:MAG: hypothetical protein V4635_08275 [Bacteroidota bacterium]